MVKRFAILSALVVLTACTTADSSATVDSATDSSVVDTVTVTADSTVAQ